MLCGNHFTFLKHLRPTDQISISLLNGLCQGSLCVSIDFDRNPRQAHRRLNFCPFVSLIEEDCGTRNDPSSRTILFTFIPRLSKKGQLSTGIFRDGC